MKQLFTLFTTGMLCADAAHAQYPNAYSSDIDWYYYNAQTVFASYANGTNFTPLGANVSGDLGGNTFTATFTNLANLGNGTSGANGASGQGVQLTPATWGAYIWTSNTNNYYPSAARYIDLSWRGDQSSNNIPAGSTGTVTFSNNLEILDQLIIGDLGDGNEILSLEFFDAAGNALDISSNVRIVHLTNDAAGNSVPVTLPSATQLTLNAGGPVSSVNNEGWAFVMRTGNVKSVRLTQTGAIGVNARNSWSFTFAKGGPDRGDAQASYGNPSIFPLGGLLRLGTHGGDAEYLPQFSSNADQDNNNNNNDEDGVSTVTPINNTGSMGQVIANYSVTTKVSNRSGTDANLIAWIDWNGNDVFDAAEAVMAGPLSSGKIDTSVTFTWNNASLNGTSGRNGTYLRIITSTDAITAGSAAANLVLSGGIGEIEDYFIPFSSPLPIELASFDVTLDRNQARLSWLTAKEENCKGFDVERSNDGHVWTKIGFVASKALNGHSSSSLIYDFMDKQAQNGKNIYRLKQVDYNDNYAYSSSRSIFINSSNLVVIFPNPAHEQINIAGLRGNEQLVVFNLLGRSVYAQLANAANVSLDIHKWEAGNYYLKIIDVAGGITVHRFVKK